MIELYTPSLDELWFRQQMMSDPPTMAYNHTWGGTIPFPREKWAAWYGKWVAHPNENYFYRYIRHDGEFVGEAAYHFDAERSIHLANVIVYAPHRGKGYGQEALLRLCECARARGVKALYDDIALDNPAIRLFLRCGFEEAYRTDAYVMVKKALSDEADSR